MNKNEENVRTQSELGSINSVKKATKVAKYSGLMTLVLVILLIAAVGSILMKYYNFGSNGEGVKVGAELREESVETLHPFEIEPATEVNIEPEDVSTVQANIEPEEASAIETNVEPEEISTIEAKIELDQTQEPKLQLALEKNPTSGLKEEKIDTTKTATILPFTGHKTVIITVTVLTFIAIIGLINVIKYKEI